MGAKVESYEDDFGNVVRDDDIVIYKDREYKVIYISYLYVNLTGNGGLHLPFAVGKPHLKSGKKEKTMLKVGDEVEIIGGKIHYFDIGEFATVKRVNSNNTLYVEGRIGQTVNFADVKLVTASPVRETTIVKKEIVPGIYGKVLIGQTSDINRVYLTISQSLNKNQLAEVIKTLQLIHDAME